MGYQKRGDEEWKEKELAGDFEFRAIRRDEADEAVAIEQICFPPNEACSERHMKERIERVPELFLVAFDSRAGRIAGFFNGIATNETAFRDEFFTDASLHEPDGESVMLLGLDVRPEYRGKGLARAIVAQYAKRERENGRKALVLTCHEEKIGMYERMGFRSRGISASVWGGEQWYEMSYALDEQIMTE